LNILIERNLTGLIIKIKNYRNLLKKCL